MVVAKRGVRGKAQKRGLKRKAPQEEDIELSSGEEFDFEEEPEEKKTILVEGSDEDSGNDSDKELQIALRDGLLKDGLNMVVEKKRPIINKTAEIKQKIAKYAKKLPWIETLDVVTKSTLTKDMINDDFEREMQFYKQAEKAVQNAVPKLLAMGVKVLRPSDYYAEMAKSDDHMQKVRKRLLKVQEGKERQEAIRRMREEKKFANKVQKQALQNKSNEKKKLMDAVKKHKKGMKQQLEDMLSNVKRYNLDKDDDDKPSRGAPASSSNDRGRGNNKFGGPNNRSKNFKRQFKDQKYGYGGKKKGMKRNTKESFEDAYQKKGGRAGGAGSGGRGGKFGGGGGRGGRGRGGGGRR